MTHFYFQSLLTTALDGIENGGVTHSMKFVGNGILIATVLYQIYDVWWRDGDYHELGSVLFKAMLMATLFNNYDAVFRLVIDAFNRVADLVYTNALGGGDVAVQWLNDLGNHWHVNSIHDLWNLVSGGLAALISALLIAVSYIVLPVVYVLFSFVYLIVGVVLYALGQLVLALYPSGALGSYTKSYLKNIVIWGLWPVLYALFADLLVLVNMDSVDAVLNQKNVLGGFVGLGSTLLLGLAGLVLAIAIGLIPVISYYVVHGDIGQAAARVAKTIGGAFKFTKFQP